METIEEGEEEVCGYAQSKHSADTEEAEEDDENIHRNNMSTQSSGTGPWRGGGKWYRYTMNIQTQRRHPPGPHLKLRGADPLVDVRDQRAFDPLRVVRLPARAAVPSPLLLGPDR
jgi:hypothetical protein